MPIGKNINVDQDESLLKKALKSAEKLFTEGEKHLCSAVQKKPVLNILPHMIIVTNKRVIKHEPKILRAVFRDYLWRDMVDVHLSDHVFGSKLIFQFEKGEIIVDSVPKNQAKKIYCIAQEKEEEWREKKRLRNMEEHRAKSGANHIVVGNHPSGGEPAEKKKPKSILKEKLLDLKELLDEGLITQDEYQNKKSHILKEI